MVGENFNFWDGKVAYDVESLLKCITEISNEEFSLYVNGKNDFANWIQGSLQNTDLAERIRPLSERDVIVAILADFLDKSKDRLIVGSLKAFHEDELVREIMEKNENFLGVREEKKENIIDPLEHENAEEKKKEENRNNQEEERNSQNQKNNEKNIEKEKKGSTISLVDFPKGKNSIDKNFFIGLMFGVIIGMLSILIIFRLFMIV
ncbi:MAG: hypothetical protein ACP5N2_00360 [Candidatus Nanoarchaeia archaeon]